MNTKHQIAFLIHTAYLSMIVFLLYIFFHTFFKVLFPFLIGFFIAYILRPCIRYLTNHTHHETRSAIICITLFYMFISTLCIVLCVKGYVYMKDYFIQLPSLYENDIQPFFDMLSLHFNQTFEGLHPDQYAYIQAFLTSVESSLSSFITSCSNRIFIVLTNTATAIPNALLSISMAFMSSFFFTKDYTLLLRFILRQLPTRQRLILLATSQQIKISMQKYILAYGKLMIITFLELCIGLSWLHVDNAFLIAFLIALFDFFPVLGAGGIMIPWIIFCYITMHTKQAVGLCILLLIMTIIRNFAEPQIVGREFNLHPLFMLAGMYIGAKFFGVFGMLVTPFILMIAKQLQEDHIIHIYRE